MKRKRPLHEKELTPGGGAKDRGRRPKKTTVKLVLNFWTIVSTLYKREPNYCTKSMMEIEQAARIARFLEKYPKLIVWKGQIETNLNHMLNQMKDAGLLYRKEADSSTIFDPYYWMVNRKFSFEEFMKNARIEFKIADCGGLFMPYTEGLEPLFSEEWIAFYRDLILEIEGAAA